MLFDTRIRFGLRDWKENKTFGAYNIALCQLCAQFLKIKKEKVLNMKSVRMGVGGRGEGGGRICLESAGVGVGLGGGVRVQEVYGFGATMRMGER